MMKNILLNILSYADGNYDILDLAIKIKLCIQVLYKENIYSDDNYYYIKKYLDELIYHLKEEFKRGIYRKKLKI